MARLALVLLNFRFAHHSRSGTLMPTSHPSPPILSPNVALDKEPRAPWYRRIVWDFVVAGIVALGLMVGIVHQMQHLEQYQRAMAAAQVCESLAMVTAAGATRRAHPDWAYDTRTTAVSQTEGSDGRWWRPGTPSFQCAVVVSAGPGFAGMRIEGTPTVDLNYTVRFSGVPNPQDPFKVQQIDVQQLP